MGLCRAGDELRAVPAACAVGWLEMTGYADDDDDAGEGGPQEDGECEQAEARLF